MNAIAEQFEERFVDFLNDRYWRKPGWSDPKFHRYEDLPVELRYLVSMSYFEQQTSNGSLAQVFWNSYPNRYLMLRLCEEGYRMIGAPPQVAAIPRVVELFREWDSEASTYLRRHLEGDEEAFGEWCAKGYLGSGKGLDELFLLSDDESSPYFVRSRWVEKHVSELDAHLVRLQKRWWQRWK